jgi:hypothetical protein
MSMPLELARELARQGEKRLDALMSLATAADLRATTLCGLFGATSVAAGAAVLTYLSSQNAAPELIWGGTVGSVGLFVAALVASIAGAPRDFYISGGSPDRLRSWAWIDGAWCSETAMLEATALRYADTIAKNAKILEEGSARVKASLIIAGSSPLLALLTYLAVHFPCST